MSRLNKATYLQNAVRTDEKRQRDLSIDYDAKHVRQAIVHTREDIVLVISYLNSIGDSLGTIRTLLLIIAIAAVVSATVLTLRFLS